MLTSRDTVRIVRTKGRGGAEGLVIHLSLEGAEQVDLIDFGFFDEVELALVLNVGKGELATRKSSAMSVSTILNLPLDDTQTPTYAPRATLIWPTRRLLQTRRVSPPPPLFFGDDRYSDREHTGRTCRRAVSQSATTPQRACA
jgi:hypothetical protein